MLTSVWEKCMKCAVRDFIALKYLELLKIKITTVDFVYCQLFLEHNFHNPWRTTALWIFVIWKFLKLLLTDVTAAGMRGLKETTPPGKTLLQAHSYSLAASVTHTSTHLKSPLHEHTLEDSSVSTSLSEHVHESFQQQNTETFFSFW